jgi:hypothetical protein
LRCGHPKITVALDDGGTDAIEDYAHNFKNSPALNEAETGTRGLLSRTKGCDGWELGKNAADDFYSLRVAKKIAAVADKQRK